MPLDLEREFWSGPFHPIVPPIIREHQHFNSIQLSHSVALHSKSGIFVQPIKRRSRIPRICEFSIFHYSICLTNTIIMYMMVSLPHRRSTELVRRPPLITAFWRVKKRDYHFWCRSYSINTINIELAHAMLDLHHWFSNCCLYGIFSIPVSIHRCWNRWIRVIASMSWKRCM